jgi:hypothetical protein
VGNYWDTGKAGNYAATVDRAGGSRAR